MQLWGWREAVIDPLIDDRDEAHHAAPVPPEEQRALVA